MLSLKNIGRAAVMSSALALTGCRTADYSRQDISPVPNSVVRDLSALADYDSSEHADIRDFPTLTFEQTQMALQEYGNLPKIKMNVYLNNQIPTSLNTTGAYNGIGAQLVCLESLMSEVPADARRMKYVLGSSGFEGAGKNQASTNCGLLGVESLTNGDNYVLVNIREKRTLGRGFKEQSKYDVAVRFGLTRDEFRTLKQRDDKVIPLTTLENAGIGFLITNSPVGAGIGAGITLLQEGIDNIKGRHPPQGSFVRDDRFAVTGLEQYASDTLNLLDTSEKLGASQAVVLNLGNGIGTLYLDNSACNDVRFGDSNCDGVADTVCYTSCRTGKNHLCDFGERALWGLLRLGIDKEIKYKEECPAHGGGRNGKQGGNGNHCSSGGGRNGRQGGNGNHNFGGGNSHGRGGGR